MKIAQEIPDPVDPTTLFFVASGSCRSCKLGIFRCCYFAKCIECYVAQGVPSSASFPPKVLSPAARCGEDFRWFTEVRQASVTGAYSTKLARWPPRNAADLAQVTFYVSCCCLFRDAVNSSLQWERCLIWPNLLPPSPLWMPQILLSSKLDSAKQKNQFNSIYLPEDLTIEEIVFSIHNHNTQN